MRSLAAVALVTALAACAGTRPPASQRVSPQVGQALSVSAMNLEGQPVTVSSTPGQVVVIDFWATWCEPCREELPQLDRLVSDHGGRVAAYAVSFDEDRAQIPPFLAEVPLRIPVLWDQGGEANAARFGVERLPTTVLVDKKGVVRFVHEGYNSRIASEQRRQIETLLAE